MQKFKEEFGKFINVLLEESGCKSRADVETKAILLRVKSRQLHRLFELACNRSLLPSEEAREVKLKHEINDLCEDLGFSQPVYQSDPRGAPVKLVFPSGRTNDWGKEGWVVPFLDQGDYE